MATTESAVQVKERPIIFGADSVRAILAGVKTQTRRVVKWKPREEGLNLSASSLSVGFYCTGVPSSGYVLCSRDGRGVWNDRTFPLHCPYGKPKEGLWVRETFALESNYNIEDERRYPPPHNDGRPVRRVSDAETAYWEQCHYRATDPTPELSCEHEACDGGEPCARVWKTPLFMPRWASRITLEVTAVRVERLQEITCEDALAEGVREMLKGKNFELREQRMSLEQHAYAEAWDELNAKRGFTFESNPFVFVISFKHIARPIGDS